MQALARIVAILNIMLTVLAEYPCINNVLMDGEMKSPCTNQSTYNLKNMQDMGGDILSKATKLTIAGWFKPSANPDLTTEWQNLFYLSTDTRGIVLPTNGSMEINNEKKRRLLAFFFNKKGDNQLEAEQNQATPVSIPNFQMNYMEKWGFYAFSINFEQKIFKMAINLVDTTTYQSIQGVFTQNIPNNFGDYPYLGLYYDSSPAYYPSCSQLKGLAVYANYDFDATNSIQILELRNSNLKLRAHYTLMSTNTINPQFLEDSEKLMPDIMLGLTRDAEVNADPTWTGRGSYQELTFTGGNTAKIQYNKMYEEMSIHYWMTINAAAPEFTNFAIVGTQGEQILQIIYKAGYSISVCVSSASCFNSGALVSINGGGGGHQAIITVAQFPGAKSIYVRIFINGHKESEGQIPAIWPKAIPKEYVINDMTKSFSNKYSMRDLRIYSGSYFREQATEVGQQTFCRSNCKLHSYKQTNAQQCVYCQSGFNLRDGKCWPSNEFCDKADQLSIHSQNYQECTPCLQIFSTSQKTCKYDTDLNPLVASGFGTIMKLADTGAANSVSQTITFPTPLLSTPQIFLSMGTFEYEMGLKEQSFDLNHSGASTTGFDINIQRLSGTSGAINQLQPFYIASTDPDIEIGTFTFTDASHPPIGLVTASDVCVEQVINFNRRFKYLPTVVAGYTGIIIIAGKGHGFELQTEVINIEKFKIKLKAFQGIPIKSIKGYYIVINDKVQVSTVIKNFEVTNEGLIFSQNIKPSTARTSNFSGPSGNSPPQTIYMPVNIGYKQYNSQGDIRRVLQYTLDTTKSAFNFQLQVWDDSRISLLSISSFALVTPCSKRFCNCDPVPPGYYNLPTKYGCPKCDWVCSYCQDSSSNCTKCRGNRVLASGCSCPDGTFEDFMSLNCQSCKFGCAKCSGSSTNCNGVCLGNRTGPDCSCPVGTVDDGQTHNCPSDTDQGCDPKCARCSILDSTKCSICAEGRVKDTNDPSKCVCPLGQIDENNICYPCHPRCDGCTGRFSYQCIKCKGSTRINPPICSCKDGLYNDDSSVECLTCNSMCKNCTGSTSKDCVSCQGNRVKNVLTSLCECPDNTYDNSTINCPTCNFKCSTCANNATNCLICAGDRTNPPYCDTCPDGKYSSDNISCSSCGYRCSTCLESPLKCTTCKGKNRKNNPPDCGCIDGYFDNGQTDCVKCNDKCKACTNSATQCQSCNENRVIDPATNTCVCPPNFFEVAGQQACVECDPLCGVCTSTGCNSCKDNRLNPPECSCPFGTFDNYPIQTKCQDCSPFCNGCVGTANKCLQCKGLRSNNPHCDTCPPGMYTTSTGPDYCASCSPICSSCSISDTNCTECTGYRVKQPVPNSNAFTCVCQAGTYEDLTSAQCRVCHPTCATCVGGSRLDCLVCKVGFVKSNPGIIQSSCECPSGTFISPDGKICQQCDYKCTTCKGPTAYDCITCKNPSDCLTIIPQPPIPEADLCKAIGILSDVRCQCADSQFYSQEQSKCLSCAKNCKHCYGQKETECTNCLDGYMQEGTKCVIQAIQQDSTDILGVILFVFLGIVTVVAFPLVYSYFINKFKKQYKQDKSGVQTNEKQKQQKQKIQVLNEEEIQARQQPNLQTNRQQISGQVLLDDNQGDQSLQQFNSHDMSVSYYQK